MREVERGLLLLCCALGEDVQPLNRREYGQVMNLLQNAREKAVEGEATADSLCEIGLNRELAVRVYCLLERPYQPGRYLQAQKDIAVITRISPQFPQRLRRLGEECPAALFCKGDVSLLQKDAVCVVGSRQLQERGAEFARYIGALAAKEGYVLISGNAVGADRMAQEACLQAGGSVISVVPDALERCKARENQLFICDEGYEFAFSTARALRRNHLIHALGEKVFVAQCPEPRGGTWAGASDNLKRKLSPVFVLDDRSEGMLALRDLGAVPVGDWIPSLRALQKPQLSIFD